MSENVSDNAFVYMNSKDQSAAIALAIAMGMTSDVALRGCAMLGGPAQVRSASREQLVQAFGEDAATKLVHWRSFLGHVADVKAGTHFTSSRSVAAYFMAEAEALTHERLWMLCLNHKQILLSTVVLSNGSESGAPIDVRQIARAAVRSGAKGVVLVHNHPSGDPTPSREDIEATRVVSAALKTVGIALIDHVIATHREIVSMLEMDLMGTGE